MTALADLAPREAHLSQGTIRYRELGTGDAIVLVHGLLTNSLIWDEMAQTLARDFRVIAPDWPLGSHSMPLEPGTDLSPQGLADLIAEFVAACELDGCTLVGNDTGGALCQLVCVSHPECLDRLVLTSCDAYDNFLPAMFRPLQVAARAPGSLRLMADALRLAPLQRLPMAFGWLSKRGLDPALVDSFLRPVRSDARIRSELACVLRGIDPRYTLEAAERFGDFHKPVLIAWAAEDRFFKQDHARLLAESFADARLELIDDSYTFVSIDRPKQTADLIARFAAGSASPPG